MATFSDPVRGGFSARIAQLELEYFEVESDIIGGKLADKRLAATLIGVFIAMAVMSTVLTWTSVDRKSVV